MLWFRQIGGALWSLLGFMIVAAVVLNLRYKPMNEGELLLDTWTGQVQSLEAVPAAETVAGKVAAEIAVLEAIVRPHATTTNCAGLRFAFPAPERVEVPAQPVRPRSDYR